jgi:4-carboxymuconolactone decarboxylase
MRLAKPRLEPLDEAEWSDEVRELLGQTGVGGSSARQPFNIFRTLAHHPALMKRWLVFGNHVLFKSTLPARERELAILRIGWLCRAEYEFAQHMVIGRQAGLSDEEIERVAKEPQDAGWSADDAALLRAVDELHADAFVSDATWQQLAKRWEPRQLVDLLFTVGQYNMVSMVLNSLGVQLDEGLPRMPA